jgi:hypothetical protein
MAETITKVRPMRYYLGQLDSSQYGSKSKMNKEAQKLRKRDIEERNRQLRFKKISDNEDRNFDRWLKSRAHHSMGERRYAVRQGTHKWCAPMGFGGCRNTGVIAGRRGFEAKCGRCKGEGVIPLRRRRKKK